MIAFVAVIQGILFFAHAVVFAATRVFVPSGHAGLRLSLGIALSLLSLTFVPASIWTFRSPGVAAMTFYRFAAVWLGLLNFLFFAALLAFLLQGGNRLAGDVLPRSWIGAAALVVALLLGLAAIVNASRVRVVGLAATLPNLPESWKGRRVAVVSDIHLGHVRGAGFLEHLIERIEREKPDLVVVPGDLYDGSKVDAARLAEPWSKLRPPQGIYFVTGNHEEFVDSSRFTGPLAAAGVRILNNEKVLLDGLQLLGIRDGEHRNRERLGSFLEGLKLDRSKPSLLLAHSPIHLNVVEAAGVSLQISGHTHGGQFLPWTWVVDRVYGPFGRGLHALGGLQVLTTVGAGTWGPPMRLGTNPEIVILTLS